MHHRDSLYSSSIVSLKSVHVLNGTLSSRVMAGRKISGQQIRIIRNDVGLHPWVAVIGPVCTLQGLIQMRRE